jgi:hypothetical protein
MDWVWVDSRAFDAVAYRRGKLYVRFHSGKVYRYFDFPRHQFDELLSAESKGTYFAEHVRGKFRYEEVGEVRLGPRLVYSSGK